MDSKNFTRLCNQDLGLKMYTAEVFIIRKIIGKT